MTTNSVALIQSNLFGDDKGTAFNDVEKVIGSAHITINTGNPIKKIVVLHGGVIDGIKTTYHQYDPSTHKVTNDTTTIYHGTSSNDNDSSLSSSDFTLTSTQNIIAISGKHGSTADYGTRIVRLSFAIYDSDTGDITYKGPYGGSEGTSFRVTANGIFVGFGGYATDTDSSVKQTTNDKKEGGLYGLTFSDIAYTKV